MGNRVGFLFILTYCILYSKELGTYIMIGGENKFMICHCNRPIKSYQMTWVIR